MAVLLRHSVVPILPVPVLEELAIIGPIGVGFFFVLSGFVLAWSWRPSESRGRFWFNRFARIYPLHILLTVVAVIILFADGTPRWTSTILSVFLLQSWFTDTYKNGGNGVSWSLSCEAFFYACFPFLIPVMSRWTVRKALIAVPVVMTAMAIYTMVYAVVLMKDLWWASAITTYTNPAYRIGEFLIGICLAVAVRQGFRLRLAPRTVLTIAGGAYILLAAFNWAVAQSGANLGGEKGLPLGVVDLMYLPVAAFLIVALASTDVEGSPSPVSGRSHVKLGQWSFALYLVQMIIIDNVVRFLPDDLGHAPGTLVLAVTIAACVAAAAVLHEYVEAPANLWLRGRARGREVRPAETITAR